MNQKIHGISVWNAPDQITLPQTTDPSAIVRYASHSLSKRDLDSIVTGFELASYEMVATFVWSKATSMMKKQLATLGLEFVGEMLGRYDLNDDSDPSTAINDGEAISLAEDLGMITTTQGFRLKQSLELVSHFVNLEQKYGEEEYMEREEALSMLKNCITSILGKPKFETAMRFADFRKALGERSVNDVDGDLQTIKASPYFFVRTTISVLMSLIKSSKGATLEHSVSNTILVVPMLWDKLREPERWQIGQAYAELSASANRLGAAGLKRTLVQVHGFDFVPESLRSTTYTETASKVLNAHFAYGNYFNETSPMKNLLNLGTSIPKPAFAKCMEATLAVWLGNRYGSSISAAPLAQKALQMIRQEQWEYYLNECLPRDRTVLDKLSQDDKPIERWNELVVAHKLTSLKIKRSDIDSLLNVCGNPTLNRPLVKEKALAVRNKIMD